ncbi:MAG: PIN domain-containing protein, partial [Dehalococcoidia bacterium]
ILRHTLQDHVDHSPRATALIQRIESGGQIVRTVDAVIFETVFTLERTYKVPRQTISSGLLKLLSLRGVQLRGKTRYRRTFELYCTYPKLSFADCFYVAVMERWGLTDLISFDQDFDRIGTITRIEPSQRGELI